MPPTVCAYCGQYFMQTVLLPDPPKLCNSCAFREEKKIPKEKNVEENIDILIHCPKKIQNEIEEYCINNGINFTKYFISLHEEFRNLNSEIEADKALLDLPSYTPEKKRGRPPKQ